jgi:hypothetical protein
MGFRIERFSPFGEIDWDLAALLAMVNLSRSGAGVVRGVGSSCVLVDFLPKIDFHLRLLGAGACVCEWGTPLPLYLWNPCPVRVSQKGCGKILMSKKLDVKIFKTKDLGARDSVSLDRHCLDYDRAALGVGTRSDVTGGLWIFRWGDVGGLGLMRL